MEKRRNSREEYYEDFYKGKVCSETDA